MKGPIVGTSIIGIGLNVNQQSFNTGMNATSMILESGRGIVVDQLLRELNFHLEKRYLQLRSSLSQLDSSFHNALFKLNVPWKYQIGSTINVMINRGVDQIGQVLLEDDFGRVNAYGLHQVKMII
jgi:BirA family biotin operon repressor/biotin-[acetyl-CoA-carboxylase] ligase